MVASEDSKQRALQHRNTTDQAGDEYTDNTRQITIVQKSVLDTDGPNKDSLPGSRIGTTRTSACLCRLSRIASCLTHSKHTTRRRSDKLEPTQGRDS